MHIKIRPAPLHGAATWLI